MTIIHLSPKPTRQWTFCTVAIILALGLMWLALDDGEKGPRGISGDPTNRSPINTSSNSPPNAERIQLLGWHFGLGPASLDSTGEERTMAGANGDNATALALGSAGALTLVGLVLLLAWKLRHSSPRGVKEYEHHRPRLVRNAPLA